MISAAFNFCDFHKFPIWLKCQHEIIWSTVSTFNCYINDVLAWFSVSCKIILLERFHLWIIENYLETALRCILTLQQAVFAPSPFDTAGLWPKCAQGYVFFVYHCNMPSQHQQRDNIAHHKKKKQKDLC